MAPGLPENLSHRLASRPLSQMGPRFPWGMGFVPTCLPQLTRSLNSPEGSAGAQEGWTWRERM